MRCFDSACVQSVRYGMIQAFFKARLSALRRFNPWRLLAALALLVGALLVGSMLLPSVMSTGAAALGDYSNEPRGPFLVRSYQGRCLTYGRSLAAVDEAGVSASVPSRLPVYLYDCGRVSPIAVAIALVRQDIVVHEINSRHEVVLRAGSKVIGVT